MPAFAAPRARRPPGWRCTSGAPAASSRRSIPRTVLRAGDSLRFVVRGERARHVEVRLRDGEAAPATVFPSGAGETALVQPRETLPVRPTLAAGGAKVIVTALFSDRARPIGAAPDDDTEVVTIAIAKE